MDNTKRKIIFGLATELGLKDSQGSADLHALVYQVAGVESLRDLDDKQADLVIAHLRQLKGSKAVTKQRPGRASDRMLYKQRELAGKLGWNESQLAAFVKRMARVDRLEWQSQRDASNVIEGLKRQLARREVTAGATATATD